MNLKPVQVVLMVVLLSLAMGEVLGQVGDDPTVPSSGGVETIVSIELWTDENMTVPFERINWGTLKPEENVTRRCFIKNRSNVRVFLKLSLGNWTPTEAENYMAVTWNLEGQVLEWDELREARFTLWISPSIHDITDFSFDLNIRALY